MKRHLPHLPEEVEDFLIGVWHTNCHDGDAIKAHDLMRDACIEHAVRQFLLDATFRNTVSPDVWEDLFNEKAPTPQMVRERAVAFWEFLYGSAPDRAELQVLAAEAAAGGQRPPVREGLRRLPRWHRIMVTLRRARAFLPEAATAHATEDPRHPDSIATLADYDLAMEAYEFELALLSLAGIAKAIGGSPRFWEVAEEAARLMNLPEGWRDRV